MNSWTPRKAVIKKETVWSMLKHESTVEITKVKLSRCFDVVMLNQIIKMFRMVWFVQKWMCWRIRWSMFRLVQNSDWCNKEVLYLFIYWDDYIKTNFFLPRWKESDWSNDGWINKSKSFDGDANRKKRLEGTLVVFFVVLLYIDIMSVH